MSIKEKILIKEFKIQRKVFVKKNIILCLAFPQIIWPLNEFSKTSDLKGMFINPTLGHNCNGFHAKVENFFQMI